jgi:hypothetical protein
MKTFSAFVKESTQATVDQDSAELKRQKEHLLDKAKEYSDQADRENQFGHGGAARAKADTFTAAAKNISNNNGEQK